MADLDAFLAAGLTAGQIEYWTRRGYLHPEAQHRRPGRRRRWSAAEFAIGICMARLVAAGLTPAAAHRVARRGSNLAPGIRVLVAEVPVADETEHVIDFRDDGWTIKHPLACRPNLFDCPVNRAAERTLAEPPDARGRFACFVTDGGELRVLHPSVSPPPSQRREANRG